MIERPVGKVDFDRFKPFEQELKFLQGEKMSRSPSFERT